MKLKSVIHHAPTNSVEATWVEVVTPEQIVPARHIPPLIDDEDNVIEEGFTEPARVIPAVEAQVRCHSYADVQMDMLEADLGADLPAYVNLIALVRSKIVPYVPPPLTADDIVTAMDNLFNAVAQAKSYDNRITCALRAGYPGPFQAEGMAFAQWMDACNALVYQMLAQVRAGTMVMPSSVEEALSLLEPMVWP